jgi:hypothetical protein
MRDRNREKERGEGKIEGEERERGRERVGERTPHTLRETENFKFLKAPRHYQLVRLVKLERKQDWELKKTTF